MIDLLHLSPGDLKKALHEMVMHGEFPTFEGMRISGCGGMGTITHGNHSVYFEGRPIATIGSLYTIPMDSHGLPCCPHFCQGTIITGSFRYLVGGVPVAIMGSQGNHAACCGPNSATVVEALMHVEY